MREQQAALLAQGVAVAALRWQLVAHQAELLKQLSVRAALQRGGQEPARAERVAETVVAGIQGALVLARALNDPAMFRRQLDHLQAMSNAALA